MPLPWQHTFCHCPKLCPTHLHFKANMCAKFNLKMLFPLNCWHNMSLPWQHIFPPFLKKFLAHLHLKANMYTQFLLNCLWNVLFFSFWNTLLPWQRTSRHCPKMCHAQLHFKRQHVCQNLIWNAFPPQFFGIICHYHGNTLSSTVKKCVLHNYTIRPPCVPNFTFKCLKSVEVVQSAKFSPFSCPDMLLPW